MYKIAQYRHKKWYLENQVKDLEVLLLFHGESLVQVSALRNPVLNLRARLHTKKLYFSSEGPLAFSKRK
jgi:hypothetical protein